MADIFISYSKQEPEPTRALAADLEARGYTTWWDTSLLPGDRFPEKIRQELEAAKTVIVIWSDGSVKSEWVYAEAQMAQRLGKLISLHTPSCDLNKVPLPFNGRHTELVTNRAKIYAALEMFGVKVQTHSVKSHTVVAVATPKTDPTDPAELCALGVNYYHGFGGVSKDYTEALRLYRKAADMGFHGAIWQLGFEHEKGYRVAKDYAEAVRFYRKAADMGDYTAADDLARCYERGIGVEINLIEAARWNKKAADLRRITCL